MKFFEYPYVIITILFMLTVVLGAIGLIFAIKGYKTASVEEEIDFINVSKLETEYEKRRKARVVNCLVYISISLDNLRSLYSETVARNIFYELKPLVLKTFGGEANGSIAPYDNQNFIVLLGGNAEMIKEDAEKCRNEINKCLLKHEFINIVDVRFGLYCPLGDVGFDDVINRAKQAAILAEQKDVFFVQWDKGNGKALEKRIKIENNIENEIDNNRFFLEYQPVIDAATKKIIGAEVLSRLNSENEGVLTPGSFLSAVDSVGINEKFDYYIFEKNCKWISNNREQREKYKYTINFSRSTLCEPLFAEKIIDIAKKYNLKSSCLAIEILEDKNITGDERKQMIKNLETLREKGFSVLLDDFGGGFTTFGDLSTLDVDIVKIDKSIVHKSNTETGFLILKNVIRTAKEIGFKTLCEGIETAEHEKVAIEAGCDMLQGYYYYRPMSVMKLEEVFETNEVI